MAVLDILLIRILHFVCLDAQFTSGIHCTVVNLSICVDFQEEFMYPTCGVYSWVYNYVRSGSIPLLVTTSRTSPVKEISSLQQYVVLLQSLTCVS